MALEFSQNRVIVVHRIRPNLIIIFGSIPGEFESDSKGLKFINYLGCTLMIALNDVGWRVEMKSGTEPKAFRIFGAIKAHNTTPTKIFK